MDRMTKIPDRKTLERLLAKLRHRLAGGFSRTTAHPATSELAPPSTGHCAVVAAIVHAQFGGQLVSTSIDHHSHWFNRLRIGQSDFDVDLTGDQFGHPPVQIKSPGRLYHHARLRSASELDAETRTRAAQLAALVGIRIQFRTDTPVSTRRPSARSAPNQKSH